MHTGTGGRGSHGSGGILEGYEEGVHGNEAPSIMHVIREEFIIGMPVLIPDTVRAGDGGELDHGWIVSHEKVEGGLEQGVCGNLAQNGGDGGIFVSPYGIKDQRWCWEMRWMNSSFWRE